MREIRVPRSTALAGLLAALVVAPNPAQASCQILWEMRNWIYKENGHCFHTPEAIKAFDNTGCVHEDVAAVPLNGFERANVEAIKQAESGKGCP
jgi:predicted cobalt transporter CbtA